MSAVRDWWLGRTVRERWLVALMLAILLPLLAWLLVARPLIVALEQAQQRHVQAVRQHGLVLAQVTQLRSAPRIAAGSTAAAPIALRVTDAAARGGISLSANQPLGPSSTAITLAPASPTAALRWLRQLEPSGIVVRELGITPQGNGLVVVNATLTQGAGR
ncbi:type II secretion system protein GspM [Sphingomonas sp. LHG3406-1]|uniref:type II secretion system protein GspM n=1 Tax=Sphingomonas sp. LHG3406-1 TaxID=2804617 RepID=UPI0026277DA4|nr:type II secretion system protein GspM [Sphingomonas sp. LHG3406-1]